MDICPHMDCTWLKSLRGMQVGSPKCQAHWHFMLPVTQNELEVKALIDREYGWTLMKRAKGLYTPLDAMHAMHSQRYSIW